MSEPLRPDHLAPRRNSSPALGDVVWTRETGSTNDDVLARLGDGDGRGEGLRWAVSDRQTAGRGRLGRVWQSPAGNLHASVGGWVGCPPSSVPLVGFVAGVALHDAVASVAPCAAPSLRLKWPNDLLLGEGKLAGILAESRACGGGRLAFAIGFGVNVRHAPPAERYPTARLCEAAPGLQPLDLFEALRVRFAERWQAWIAAGFAFDATAAAWTRRALPRGTPIRVTQPARHLVGRFGGLDASGRLLIDTPNGRAAIEAGDVALQAPGPSQDSQDDS